MPILADTDAGEQFIDAVDAERVWIMFDAGGESHVEFTRGYGEVA